MSALRRALLALGLALIGGMACAQSNFPDGKLIRIIVPFPAGGQTDIVARVIGQAIAESLKTPVVVENKGGAHGFIGMSEVAKAAPDGHTLAMASTGIIAINPKLYEKIPYDTNKDFAPVSLVMTVPIVAVINPQVLPVNSASEFVAYVKANPTKVNFASAGSGGSSHLVGEYLKFVTGSSMAHIAYKGEGPALGDVIAGHVQVMFATLVASTPYVKSGMLRMLAVTTRERLPEYPDVPTMAEALKIDDFEASSWAALYAPAATPPEIVKRLASEVDTALQRPDIAKRLKELGALRVGGAPEKLATFQRAEQEKWGKVIQAGKIKPD